MNVVPLLFQEEQTLLELVVEDAKEFQVLQDSKDAYSATVSGRLTLRRRLGDDCASRKRKSNQQKDQQERSDEDDKKKHRLAPAEGSFLLISLVSLDTSKPLGAKVVETSSTGLLLLLLPAEHGSQQLAHALGVSSAEAAGLLLQVHSVNGESCYQTQTFDQQYACGKFELDLCIDASKMCVSKIRPESLRKPVSLFRPPAAADRPPTNADDDCRVETAIAPSKEKPGYALEKSCSIVAASPTTAATRGSTAKEGKFPSVTAEVADEEVTQEGSKHASALAEQEKMKDLQGKGQESSSGVTAVEVAAKMATEASQLAAKAGRSDGGGGNDGAIAQFTELTILPLVFDGSLPLGAKVVQTAVGGLILLPKPNGQLADAFAGYAVNTPIPVYSVRGETCKSTQDFIQILKHVKGQRLELELCVDATKFDVSQVRREYLRHAPLPMRCDKDAQAHRDSNRGLLSEQELFHSATPPPIAAPTVTATCGESLVVRSLKAPTRPSPRQRSHESHLLAQYASGTMLTGVASSDLVDAQAASVMDEQQELDTATAVARRHEAQAAGAASLGTHVSRPNSMKLCIEDSTVNDTLCAASSRTKDLPQRCTEQGFLDYCLGSILVDKHQGNTANAISDTIGQGFYGFAYCKKHRQETNGNERNVEGEVNDEVGHRDSEETGSNDGAVFPEARRSGKKDHPTSALTAATDQTTNGSTRPVAAVTPSPRRKRDDEEATGAGSGKRHCIERHCQDHSLGSTVASSDHSSLPFCKKHYRGVLKVTCHAEGCDSQFLLSKQNNWRPLCPVHFAEESMRIFNSGNQTRDASARPHNDQERYRTFTLIRPRRSSPSARPSETQNSPHSQPAGPAGVSWGQDFSTFAQDQHFQKKLPVSHDAHSQVGKSRMEAGRLGGGRCLNAGEINLPRGEEVTCFPLAYPENIDAATWKAASGLALNLVSNLPPDKWSVVHRLCAHSQRAASGQGDGEDCKKDAYRLDQLTAPQDTFYLSKVCCATEGCTQFTIQKRLVGSSSICAIKWLCAAHCCTGATARRCVMDGCKHTAVWNRISCCHHLPKSVQQEIAEGELGAMCRAVYRQERQNTQQRSAQVQQRQLRLLRNVQKQRRQWRAAKLKQRRAARMQQQKLAVAATVSPGQVDTSNTATAPAEQQVDSQDAASRDGTQHPESCNDAGGPTGPGVAAEQFTGKTACARATATTLADAVSVEASHRTGENGNNNEKLLQQTTDDATDRRAAKSVKQTTSKKEPGAAVISGLPPDDVIPGGWPAGWIKQKVRRREGMLAGRVDHYWFTPVLQRRLRSLKEVRRFMGLLGDHSGDENLAWKAMKGTK